MVHKDVCLIFRAVMKWTPTHPLIERFVSHTLLLTISNITHVEDSVGPDVNYFTFPTKLTFACVLSYL